MPDGTNEAALLYSSGITGRPKGCILSNEYLHTWGTWYAGVIGLRVGAEADVQSIAAASLRQPLGAAEPGGDARSGLLRCQPDWPGCSICSPWRPETKPNGHAGGGEGADVAANFGRGAGTVEWLRQPRNLIPQSRGCIGHATGSNRLRRRCRRMMQTANQRN
jgi:hypothetical protein